MQNKVATWTPNQQILLREFLCMDEEFRPAGRFAYPEGMGARVREQLEDDLRPRRLTIPGFPWRRSRSRRGPSATTVWSACSNEGEGFR